MILCWLISPSNVQGDSGWRGDGTGRFPDAQPPKTWSKEANVVWKTELPSRSYASPALSHGRLFVLSEPATVICVDQQTGEILWQKKAGYAEALGEQKAAEIEATQKKFDQERREIQNQIRDIQKINPEAKELLIAQGKAEGHRNPPAGV